MFAGKVLVKFIASTYVWEIKLFMASAADLFSIYPVTCKRLAARARYSLGQ